MKRIIPVLLATCLTGPALGFQVFNKTDTCVYVKEYYHIFNRYNEHITAHGMGQCDPSSSRCTGQLDFRVIKHSDGGEIQIEEPLCTWEGDVGDSTGTFSITANPNVEPGEKGWCSINYNKKKTR